MASVRKYRDKWRAEIRRQGHKPTSKVFITKKAAKKWANETEVAIESGDLYNLSNKTVGDAIERYRKEQSPIQYQQTILSFWEDELGKLKLSHIRRAHVVAARDKLKKQKVSRGPGKGKPLASSGESPSGRPFCSRRPSGRFNSRLPT